MLSNPPSATKSNFLPWLLGVLGCLGLMCCGGMGGVGVWWGMRPSGKRTPPDAIAHEQPGETHPVPKKEQQPPVGFSLTDAEKAAEWMISATTISPEVLQNELARREDAEKRAAEMKQLRGLKVDWRLKVQSVTQSMIFVHPVAAPNVSGQMIVTSYESMEAPSLLPKEGEAKDAILVSRLQGLPRFPHHKEDWVRQLKNGSLVRVIGRIKGVSQRTVIITEAELAPE